MSILLSCLVAPLVLFCLAGPSIAAGEQTEAMFYVIMVALKISLKSRLRKKKLMTLIL